ncbi:hypothetical protein [Photobacterium nomapromontoriensis]|uniref:hypothetical protein n=1 Tax=Photobacterium nomapromontoriensis TaxID=2910237 RepID=UPI003D0BDD0C
MFENNKADIAYKISLLLCWIVTLACCSFLYYQSVFYFNRTPWDGTFQTLFPLLKMDHGSFPGEDYFYFHGNGIPYLLYPLYFIFKNVFNISSVMSALTSTYIINTLFLLIPMYMLLRKVMSVNIASAVLLFYLAVCNFIPYTGGYLSPLFLGAPMAIRFSPHIIMALVVFYILDDVKSSNLFKLALFGVIGAICVFLAAEQGFYAVGGALVAMFIYYFTVNIKQAFIFPFSALFVFICCFIGLNYLLFGNIETIKSIQVISNDQAWVFGVFPNRFYDNFSEVFSFDIIDGVPSQVTTIVSVLATLFVIVLMLTKTLQGKSKIFAFSLFTLFFGSLLSWASNIGYIGAHQAALNVRYLYLIGSFVALGLFVKKGVN